jgi:hypothetical protein
MRQIQLTDQYYELARRRAAAAGFSSIDDYVSSLINDDYLHPVS